MKLYYRKFGFGEQSGRKISDFESKIGKYDKKIKFGAFFEKPLGTRSKQI